jgi:hypothetical protein
VTGRLPLREAMPIWLVLVVLSWILVVLVAAYVWSVFG